MSAGGRKGITVTYCARKDLVREGEIGSYHCWSRCVQKAYLCGYDQETQRDFSYRRGWIEDLLAYQARLFAVDVGSYSILSNHLHAILRTRPDIAAGWSDEELALRWKMAWPTWQDGQWVSEPSEAGIDQLLACPDKINRIRGNLSSLSWFMARWKEPIARLCNAEMDRKGHFWEARFGCRELLDEEAVLTCSIYVDLNQIRAGLADSLESSHWSSIQRRIRAVRSREAAASREAFTRRDHATSHRFSQRDAESLFADCWLAPIVDQDTSAANDRPPPAIETIAGSAVEKPEAPVSCAVDESEAPADEVIASHSECRSAARKRRWRAMLARRRASDTPMMTVRWSEYLRITRSLAAFVAPGAISQLAPQQRDSQAENVAEVLQGWGMNPIPWLEALSQLDSQCTRALGTAGNMLRRALEASQRCFHGIRLCRSIFVQPEGTTFT
jgi:REP element-mobilizing transposase RayT